MLDHKCPSCGRQLGYEGLCWLCRAEKDRREAQAWTAEQIAEKQRKITQNITALDDWKSEETKDLWSLISYRLEIRGDERPLEPDFVPRSGNA